MFSGLKKGRRLSKKKDFITIVFLEGTKITGMSAAEWGGKNHKNSFIVSFSLTLMVCFAKTVWWDSKWLECRISSHIVQGGMYIHANIHATGLQWNVWPILNTPLYHMKLRLQAEFYSLHPKKTKMMFWCSIMEGGNFPVERSRAISSLFVFSFIFSFPLLIVSFCHGVVCFGGGGHGQRKGGGKKRLFFQSRQHSQGLYLSSNY